MNKKIPTIDGNLRSHMIRLPEVINEATGIAIFGKLIKSLIFTTDLAIIRNHNADAIIAVYPFTPQPVIIESILAAADVPVICGIGGGTTTGNRVIHLAADAEFKGAIGVVLNSPTTNDILHDVSENLDIPVVITITSIHEDFEARIKSGAKILNVSGAADTPSIVRKIREKHKDIPIIATGGPNEDTIKEVINAGANAITYTPKATKEIFKDLMAKYRNQKF